MRSRWNKQLFLGFCSEARLPSAAAMPDSAARNWPASMLSDDRAQVCPDDGENR